MDKIFTFLIRDLQLSSTPLDPDQTEQLQKELMRRYFPHVSAFPHLLYLQKANGVGILHLDEKRDWERCIPLLKQQELVIFFDQEPGQEKRIFFTSLLHQGWKRF